LIPARPATLRIAQISGTEHRIETNASTVSCAYKRGAGDYSADSVHLEEINMQAFIGAKLLSSKVAQPTKKPFEIYDSRLCGFTLRVQPTGVRSYYARFGRSRRIALGKVGALRPDQARERCQQVLGNVAIHR
jgi:hypothetical protein